MGSQEKVKQLIELREKARLDPIDRKDDELNIIIPENTNHSYNIKDIIYKIVDYSEFLEIHAGYARNIVVGFAKMGGMPVGIIANQPNFLAGVLDIDASRKAARFVRFCDAFNVAVITLVDVPGFFFRQPISMHSSTCQHENI